MQAEQDSSGHAYIETDAPMDEHIRVTFVPADRAGFGEDSLRVQVRPVSGKLRMGPEIPLGALPDVVAAMTRLALNARG